jgi:acyl-CoA synthetase (AMP-forming)/AMP-acid ligase II
MVIDFLLDRFREHHDRQAIIWRDQSYNYDWLLNNVQGWQKRLLAEAIPSGAVVMLEADFSPMSVALFLALAGHGCVVVPLSNSVAAKKEEFVQIAQGEVRIILDANDGVSVSHTGWNSDHEFYGRLRQARHSGLVLFSSGSTGKSKAVVHDLAALFEKFKVSRHALRTVTFLLFDHIGGVNTMLYILSNGGCMITVQSRAPDAVLAAVARHQVELLPTSPTFLNLILLSEAWRRHNLASLQTVTYGTEPMLESTLQRFHEVLPQVKLLQTYGLSEVGILRSQSRSSNSLWVRVGGDGFETRIVEGVLQIKAHSAMLGYLNAPSPFTSDGWFNTGDMVEVDGDYIRFLGRKSEIINVGGEKVFPAEIESVIQQMSNVEEVSVHGERNPITGNIVVAKVKLLTEEPASAFRQRLWEFCRNRLPVYKIPQKITLVSELLSGARFKKMRRDAAGESS